LDDGYGSNQNDYSPNVCPHRASNYLNVLAYINTTDLEDYQSGGEFGFYVHMHSPDELPNFDDGNFFVTTISRKMNIFLQPKIVRTKDKLKSVDPERRNCYFHGERKLRFFKVYTKHHCNLECKANLSMSILNCVRLDNVRDINTKTCDLSQLYASRTIDMLYYVFKAQKRGKIIQYYEKIFGRSLMNETFDCNCLDTCSTIVYEAKAIKYYLKSRTMKLIPYKWGHGLMQKPANLSEDVLYTAFSIRPQDYEFETKMRDEAYGWRDMIANFGGIIGKRIKFY
jgi:hypothetical protein